MPAKGKSRASSKSITRQKAIKQKAVKQRAVPSLTYIGTEGGYTYFRSKAKKRK